jgi:hypothetical protein
MTTDSITSKVWSFCHTLRDDGVGYGDYLEQFNRGHLGWHRTHGVGFEPDQILCARCVLWSAALPGAVKYECGLVGRAFQTDVISRWRVRLLTDRGPSGDGPSKRKALPMASVSAIARNSTVVVSDRLQAGSYIRGARRGAFPLSSLNSHLPTPLTDTPSPAGCSTSPRDAARSSPSDRRGSSRVCRRG